METLPRRFRSRRLRPSFDTAKVHSCRGARVRIRSAHASGENCRSSNNRRVYVLLTDFERFARMLKFCPEDSAFSPFCGSKAPVARNAESPRAVDHLSACPPACGRALTGWLAQTSRIPRRSVVRTTWSGGKGIHEGFAKVAKLVQCCDARHCATLRPLLFGE
jgi:hypothetical protein